MKLRDYQLELVEKTREHYRKGAKSVLIQSGTGSGKTVTSSYILKSTAERGRRCLWVVHRREIILQASRTFWDMGIDHGLIMGGGIVDRSSRVHIASVQTLARMLDKLPEYDFVCVDESHHTPGSQYKALLDRFPDAWKLGLTATPWRLDRQGLGPWYEQMVCGPSVSDLIDRKALAPFRMFAPSVPDLSAVHITAGDFNGKEVADAMDKPKLIGDVVSHYQRIAPNTRAIVFACSIEHSRHIVSQFRDAGISAEHVDGGDDSEYREAAIARFRSGHTQVLSNCSLFDEGFDVPAVETVIMARPTQSLSMYLQQCGRGLRYVPGKTAIILDHAGNCERHGMPDDDREWSLEDRERRPRGEKTTEQAKRCDQCLRVHKPAPACPHCGHVYPIQPRQITQEEGELMEITAKRERRQEQGQANSLDALINLGRQRGMRNPHGWARNVLAARAAKDANRALRG